MITSDEYLKRGVMSRCDIEENAWTRQGDEIGKMLYPPSTREMQVLSRKLRRNDLAPPEVPKLSDTPQTSAVNTVTHACNGFALRKFTYLVYLIIL
jgi:hypothetical protein